MTATPYHGHEMSPRVEDARQRERQLTSARRYKIAAVILVVVYLAVLSLTAYVARPMSPRDWISLGTGSLCGSVVFFGIPWFIGFTKARQAADRLYLNGSQLTIVGMASKEPTTLDLGATRVQVRLDWLVDSDLVNSKALTDEQRAARIAMVHKSLDKRIANGTAPCVYVPVLLLYRDSDGHAFPILLADNKTRRIRDAGEIHMLERAMQFAHDPAIQHAAAQLRTVAGWQKLPAIYDARPDAIPPTPVDHPPGSAPIPTPVLRGQPAPEIVVTGEAGKDGGIVPS